MADKFKYLFRFCCDPKFNGKTELDALAPFVTEAEIDDVMVFANVQEINTGHMSFDEQQIFIDYSKSVAELVHPLGATMSINHWHSIMHGDFGKSLNPSQNFNLMVDPYGKKSTLCVCPMDKEWQKYIAEIYRKYAEIHPEILWVEDDFRLHNHAPLVWGGCFCDEHMNLYSKLAGKTLTREEFVNGVLKPGEPHPYRKIWLDVSREMMITAAENIGEAVRAVSPSTKVGLMSSVPYVHSAEGRDWHGILNGLAAGNIAVSRPHLPTYCETAACDYQMRFNAVTMQTRALIPSGTEVYPELENFPYSRFVKSKKFTRFQMLSAMPLNPAGMTIDLYDLNGNGIVWEEGYQHTLAQTKDFLNSLCKGGTFALPADGVAVMHSQDSSYTLHTKSGAQMDELYPCETLFASLLPAYGIPFYFCSDKSVTGKCIAVSGQYFRNLSKSEITELFNNNFVIIDGDSAQVLFEIGLGNLCSANSFRWMKQDGGEYCYEEVASGKEYVGRLKARCSSMLLASDAAAIEYGDGVLVFTNLCNSFRTVTANGMVKYKNAAVFPYGNFDNPPHTPPRAFLTTLRQQLFTDIISSAEDAFDVPPIILNSPHLNPYYYKLENGFKLYLVNACGDDADEIRIFVGSRKISKITAVGSKDNKTREISFTASGGIITLPLAIESLETALVTFERKD